jgi:transposase
MESENTDEFISEEERYEVSAIEAFLAKQIKAKDLAMSLGLKLPQTYKLVQRYKEFGALGLISGKKGKSNRAYSEQWRSNVIEIVKEHYHDFGPQFATEKLKDLHGILISTETLRTWMMAEGLWIDRAGRQPRIFQPRKPREKLGELIQVDGSYHRWFEKRGPEACLLVFIDDATSRIMKMLMVEHESSFNYMRTLKHYIERYGRPGTLYAVRHSIFRKTNTDKNGKRSPTQFAKACHDLGIGVICAYSPQAKGRVERANRTLQNRLIKEMRLRGISTIEEANWYLDEYIKIHNAKFARLPADPIDAHLPAHNLNLDALMVYTVARKVFKDLTVSFNKIRYILEDSQAARQAIGKRVTVAVRLNGQLEIMHDETSLPYRFFDKIRSIDETLVVDRKRLGSALALAKTIADVEPHQYKRNNNIASGFREFFTQPNDPKSRELQNASPETRAQYGGRARGKLHQHPIIIVEQDIKNAAEKMV